MQEHTARSFADIDIGDEIGPISRAVTLEAVQRYGAVAGLVDRRFLEIERAQQTGFRKPIVPGPLSTTFLAQMLIDHFPGWRLRSLHTTYRSPVGHGDMLTFGGMVTEKTEEDGVATVHCDVVVENEQGERAIVGTAILQLRQPQV